MNPAVSVALACVGKFPARKLLWYLPAQYVGAWLGSAFVLMTYRDAIIEFYGGDDDRDWDMDTAGIFVTSPAKGISNVFAAIDQVIALNHLDLEQCHSRALVNYSESMILLFHPAPDADCWHRAAVAGSLRYWIFQERRSVI